MKTFTKTMSMILIAVMCFSLFATSAFASGEFSLDGSSSSNVSFSADSSAGFGDSGFSLDSYTESFQSVAETQSEAPVQPQAPQEESFGLEQTAQAPAAAETKAAEDAPVFTLEDVQMLGTPYQEDMKFQASPSSIKVTDTDAAATVTISKTSGTGTLEGDTFKRLSYSTSPSGENRQAIPATGFEISGGTITIQGSWLKTLTAGQTYYFYGERTDELPIKLGFVAVNAASAGDYGTFTVSPSTYTQYSSTDPNLYNASVSVTGAAANAFASFSRFAVISQGASSGGSYADGYTWISADQKTLIFERTFMDSLKAGYYDIYGVTTAGQNIKLGSVYIKSGNGGNPAGTWTLWPDYSIPWTSGDDPLMFKSNLMAKRQSYPSYTIVPRYGFGAGSTPNNMIDVNQFWDMGDGVFALGTNFLRSLPAGTYTLQVVDYKHLNDCTNVVTFRIGSTLRPIDTDKHVIGSIKNLRFLCDEPVYEVYVGNIPLTYGEDYALSNGNKTITLSFEFLNKRSAGNTYTIKALTASGTYPSSTFQILSTAQGSASPRTGDESNLGLWAAFLLLSGAAVVVLVPKLRKHDF